MAVVSTDRGPQLTLKGLTGHLGPRPTFPRSSESPAEFKLRRQVWRQTFLLFTTQHRLQHRLLRISLRRTDGTAPEGVAREPEPVYQAPSI